MLIPALMLASIAAMQAPPTLGPSKNFGDWEVACDNTKSCTMTSLVPEEATEGSGYDQVSVSVARAAGPAGAWSVEVQLPAGHGPHRITARIDAAIIAAQVPGGDFARFTGADAARIVAAMANGEALHIVGSGDALIGRASLKGSSAALRFIDAEQGRAGTVTAAVAKGRTPASAVPAAPPVPHIAFARPTGKTASFTPAMRTALDRSSECASTYEGGEGPLPEAEVAALTGGKTLVLLPCGSGAYNASSVAYILEGGKPVLARFDLIPGAVEGELPMLVNASWEPASAQLSSYYKGRGIGDCGAAETYVWDGSMFRLIEARRMVECRGSVNWLPVWRAKPVAK